MTLNQVRNRYPYKARARADSPRIHATDDWGTPACSFKGGPQKAEQITGEPVNCLACIRRLAEMGHLVYPPEKFYSPEAQ